MALPELIDTFHGRVHELDELTTILRSRQQRIITLTGVGGVGKTRLALRLAVLMEREFADGVVFVDLSSIQGPSLVSGEIARALDLSASSAAPETELREYLEDLDMLLVLDNFEHVLAAASLVEMLVQNCPYLVILATSIE